MEYTTLTAISPIDGRYADKCETLREHVSEHGLIRYRVTVEIHWLIALLEEVVEPTPSLNDETKAELLAIINNFSIEDSQAVKKIESSINHDVKAVEYFIKSKLKEMGKSEWAEWVHFACTSEDINNLAYALMLKQTRDTLMVPLLEEVLSTLKSKAHNFAQVPMMSRTHGQPATPTTLGKELANVVYRLNRQVDHLKEISILGKLNGAVGNFNAHLSAFPQINWIKVARSLVERLDLNWNPYTTQIEPHDWIAEYFDNVKRINIILIDLCRDMWGYISLGYFYQKPVKGEIGSSTMPHKINPIDFENAEGNLGVSNALAEHFSNKLPISRMQRDLTDSTVLRNVGSACAYQFISIKSLLNGLNKVEADADKMLKELNENWMLLAEPIQTILRKHGVENPYELLKDLTRGEAVSKESLHAFIDGLQIPADIKNELKQLTPEGYIGAAATLAQHL